MATCGARLRSARRTDVLGFKGLARRAVVLVVNKASASERSRQRMNVGWSREHDKSWCARNLTSARTSAGRILLRPGSSPSAMRAASATIRVRPTKG